MYFPRKQNMRKVKDWRKRKYKVYMDEVNFRHELGQNMRGNKVYPSKADLEREETCTKQCGIVLVEIKFIHQVRKDKFKEYIKKYLLEKKEK